MNYTKEEFIAELKKLNGGADSSVPDFLFYTHDSLETYARTKGPPRNRTEKRRPNRPRPPNRSPADKTLSRASNRLRRDKNVELITKWARILDMLIFNPENLIIPTNKECIALKLMGFDISTICSKNKNKKKSHKKRKRRKRKKDQISNEKIGQRLLDYLTRRTPQGYRDDKDIDDDDDNDKEKDKRDGIDNADILNDEEKDKYEDDEEKDEKEDNDEEKDQNDVVDNDMLNDNQKDDDGEDIGDGDSFRDRFKRDTADSYHPRQRKHIQNSLKVLSPMQTIDFNRMRRSLSFKYSDIGECYAEGSVGTTDDTILLCETCYKTVDFGYDV